MVNIQIMDLNDLTYQIIGCAYKIHSRLGPGLLESTYEVCMEYELIKNGFEVKKQVALPVIYDEVKLDAGYRIDLIVNNSVIIEIKSVESLTDVHLAQVLTYLKLSDCKLGLLINFNVSKLKDGIRRVVNNL